MPHPRYPSDVICRQGEEIYATKLRRSLETPENVGRLISIDIETGEYEIGDDLAETGKRMLARNPGAVMYGMRIGYDTAFAVGGAMRRTAP